MNPNRKTLCSLLFTGFVILASGTLVCLFAHLTPIVPEAPIEKESNYNKLSATSVNDTQHDVLPPEQEPSAIDLGQIQGLTRNISTTKWKTYRNEEYNYELDYPTDWEISSVVGVHGGTIINAYSTHPSPYALMQIRKQGTVSDISKWYRDKAQGGQTYNILIDNLNGVSMDDPSIYHSMLLLDFVVDDTVFQIEWYDHERQHKETYSLFLKLISTLRFI
jgi:hypothetical protein